MCMYIVKGSTYWAMIHGHGIKWVSQVIHIFGFRLYNLPSSKKIDIIGYVRQRTEDNETGKENLMVQNNQEKKNTKWECGINQSLGDRGQGWLSYLCRFQRYMHFPWKYVPENNRPTPIRDCTIKDWILVVRSFGGYGLIVYKHHFFEAEWGLQRGHEIS